MNRINLALCALTNHKWEPRSTNKTEISPRQNFVPNVAMLIVNGDESFFEHIHFHYEVCIRCGLMRHPRVQVRGTGVGY